MTGSSYGGAMLKKFIFLTLGLVVIYYALESEFAVSSVQPSHDLEKRIRVVGSSTVFPFSAIAAEYFGKKTGHKTPIIEATGTGGGMQAFCAGIGEATPDMSNASRRIKASEVKKCQAHGVTDILEIPLGFDGLVIAGARQKDGIRLNLTKEKIFRALAPRLPVDGVLVPNPNKSWKDIDPSLPDREIKVLGPPPTSGTRDSFAEMVLEEGCKSIPGARALGLHKKACHAIREDGHWQDMGENDNLIVQKVNADPDNIGIFGFAYYNENKNLLRAANIHDVAPTFETIKNKDYAIARPLFVYVKREHFALKPSLKYFAYEFLSNDAAGDFGYLADRGLVPLTAEERGKVRKSLEL
ncbi:MAG: substrate-binding domain-containing protein [Pseudomonadota bacterium]